MKRRSFTLVVALLVAVTPVISVICAVDCTHPPAATPCHGQGGAETAALHGATHGCDHDHTGAEPALLTSGTGREPAGSSVTAPQKAEPAASFRYDGGAVLAMHGPPGLNSRGTSSHITILRL